MFFVSFYTSYYTNDIPRMQNTTSVEKCTLPRNKNLRTSIGVDLKLINVRKEKF